MAQLLLLTEQSEPPDPNDLVFAYKHESQYAKEMIARGNSGWIIIPYSEARKLAEESVTNLFRHAAQLRHILERKEAVIRKRWLKNKNYRSRQQILTTAWPNTMPDVHRPNYQNWFDWCKTPASQKTSAYKWPSINLKDLSHPQALLLLLNSRGRHHPCLHLQQDYKDIQIGRKAGVLGVAGLAGYRMLLPAQGDEKSFGKIQWFGLIQHKRDIPNGCWCACDGLLLLEIQIRVWEFLLKTCYLILADLPEATLLGPAFPIFPEPDPLKSDAKSWLDPFEDLRVQAHLDVDKLLRLIGAKRDATEDELWEMRENPTHFESVMSVYLMAFRPNTLKNHNKEEYWGLALDLGICDTYRGFTIWSLLYQQVSKLHPLSDRSIFDSVNGSSKREELGALVVQIVSVVSYYVIRIMGKFRTAIRYSPGIAPDLFNRNPVPVQAQRRRATHASEREADRLETLLSLFLRVNSQALDELNTSAFIDEMQHLLDTMPAQKKRLSTYATELFSDIALVLLITKDISSFFYSVTGQYEMLLMGHDEVMSENKDLNHGQTLFDELVNGSCDDVFKLARPLLEGLPYPDEKPRTFEHVQTLRSAEQQLDSFWIAVDDRARRQLGQTFLSMLVGDSGNEREVVRTPEWIAMVPHESSSAGSEQAPLGSFHHLSIEPDRPGKYQGNFASTKPKTRGTPSHNTPAPDDLECLEGDTTSSALEVPVFAVGKRDWKVFSTVFHNSSENCAKGELPWTDFVSALNNIGFKSEKLYGSVWQFTPSKLDVGNSIHIHEPHPASKIPFRNAKRIGRRLSRTYGLTGSSFVLK